MYNQAKNVVLNVSEMEAKVQEATNDEPWGASSTLMTDIAQGTFNFQQFNEIMPAIYSRFMEKEARQWRQIYKALQLLEYLVKHGSERVVDDARSHISTLKMLRNFHYIDDKGKDQGINVRNRAKELVELLGDVEKIRTERRKAKANKHKYTGTGNDGGYGSGMSFSSGGSRYGGFGSESFTSGGGGSSSYDREYGSYSGGGYSGGGSSTSGGFRDSTSRGGFEEYNAGDDEIDVPRRSNSITASRASAASRATPTLKAAAPTPPPPPAPVVDLLGGFGDDDFGAPTSAPAPTAPKTQPLATAAPVSLDDDDFADFQAAPTSPAPAISPATTAPVTHNRGPSKPTLMDMLNSNTPSSTIANRSTSNTAAAQQALFGATNVRSPPVTQPTQNLFGGNVMASTPMMSPTSPPSYQQQRVNTMSPKPMGAITPAAKPAAATPKSANFDDLWNMSLGSSSAAAKPAVAGKSMKDLEKEKAQSGLWGSAKPAQQPAFGTFGTAAPPSSNAGGDDLLL